MTASLRIAYPSDGMVEARKVAVAAQHPASALAGVEIYAAGGNAVDAAVATGLAACVADVVRTGIGGYGGELVYHEAASGKTWLVDFPTRAPIAAHSELFEALPGDPLDPGSGGWWRTTGNVNQTGPLAVGVPAVVAGLAAAHFRFGKLPWAEVVGPAIRLAEEGVEVSPFQWGMLQSEEERLAACPQTLKQFLEGWEGNLLRQPDLGKTLRLLASEGPRAFYEGDIAHRIVKHLRAHGGVMDSADLAGYTATVGEALRSGYRGHTVFTAGDVSGAGILVPTLRVLDRFDVPAMEPLGTERMALLAEVTGRVWPDRLSLAGDLAIGNPASQMFTESYVNRVCEDLRLGRRRPPASPQECGCTDHLSVADIDGNIVACTTTTMMNLGSGVLVPGTGIVLNNAMALFDPVPGRPNSLGPAKRGLTNMCPTIVLKDGRPVLGIGASGGRRVTSMIMQATTLMLDFGWPLDRALAAPRFHYQGGPYYFLEDRYPAETLDGLRARGHELSLRPWGGPDLGGQSPAVWFDGAGHLFGAPDPRKTGAAAAL